MKFYDVITDKEAHMKKVHEEAWKLLDEQMDVIMGSGGDKVEAKHKAAGMASVFALISPTMSEDVIRREAVARWKERSDG